MTDKLIATLVKMADKFDQEGEFDLAADVDKTLRSLAARPKAPLKSLDDDVKKHLIIFIDKADKNMKSSIKGLNEFFRRLRYFDVADSIKEMGLDRAVKDMEKTQGCLGDALKKFYEITHGKRPAKKELEEMLNDDGAISAAEDGALDFFASQDTKDGEEQHECNECDHEDDIIDFLMDEDYTEDEADDWLKEFWADDGE